MKQRLLGKTDLKVSEIGHGLWGMGGWSGSNDDESIVSLETSLSLGCNFFDTAWAYGSGASDKLLGKLIKNNPDKKIISAGKIPPKNFVWPANPNDSISSVFPKDHIIEYTEKSLENLGISTIDIMQFHVWDDAWADNEDWKNAIAELKRQKLINHFGISLNRWEPWNGIKAIKTGMIDTVQVIYNIFDQSPEDELFPVCKEYNVGIIARVPLDEGGLSGNLSKDTKFSPEDWRSKYFGSENLPETVDRAERLKSLLPQGMSLAEMALKFILSNSQVSTTIVGMRKLTHVKENLSVSSSYPLSASLVSKLKQHRWDRKVTPWAN